MPTRVGQLQARCHKIMGRMSPSVSLHASDDDEAADEAVADHQAADTSGMMFREQYASLGRSLFVDHSPHREVYPWSPHCDLPSSLFPFS
jgi:hypothetical protein